MSTESLNVHDPRGFIFTIDRQREPVYQVESKHWARAEHRWPSEEIPPEIRAKAAELELNGKPGAFAQFQPGEDGVYVLCEKNIRTLPEVADNDVSLSAPVQTSSGRKLSRYDIVVLAKGGTIRSDTGEVYETQGGEFYVIPYSTWGRFLINPSLRPQDVETTKEVLHLLEDLNGKNFLSMTPDPSEVLPQDMPPAIDAIIGITCYVLNLARFKR